ncbi:hypothetical protein BDN72DRAFT_905929 [Pluteus cervinus]|uniref:Uncharacterized protein n=1 Tax=Pluteus cervinus TaxID=181527 RepID=A0ACD3A130_9AGAR|nr:hypothetical protein BDN72DRAFT_905929 [Pluteus cervinus]
MPLPRPGESPTTRTSTAVIDWNDLPTRFGIPLPPSSYAPSVAFQATNFTNATSLSSDASSMRSTPLTASSSASGGSSSMGLQRKSSTSGVSTDDEAEPEGTTKAPLGRQRHKFYNSPGQTNWFEVLMVGNESTIPEPGAFKLNGLRDGDLFVVRESPRTIHRMQIYKNNTWSPIQFYDEMIDSAEKTRVLIMKPGGKPSWVLKDTALKNYNSSRQARVTETAQLSDRVSMMVNLGSYRYRPEPVDWLIRNWYFTHRDVCIYNDESTMRLLIVGRHLVELEIGQKSRRHCLVGAVKTETQIGLSRRRVPLALTVTRPPTNSSSRMDTRSYTTPRVSCYFDYDGPRTFVLGLSGWPDPLMVTNFHCHDVVDPATSLRYELWSPNASLSVVFPGVAPKSFSLDRLPSPPRFDGSGGRWDWSLNPQYLQSRTIHRAFIRRINSFYDEPVPSEFWHLADYWESYAHPNIGKPSRRFLDELKSRSKRLTREASNLVRDNGSRIKDFDLAYPPVLSDANFIPLEAPRTWDFHLDHVTQLQRTLKEIAAWILCITKLDKFDWPLQRLTGPFVQGGYPVGDERFMGGWMNEFSNSSVLFLIGSAVPCYFTHRYEEGMDFGETTVFERRNPQVAGFVPSILPAHLLPEFNPYIKLAEDRNAPRLTSTLPYPPPCSFPTPHTDNSRKEKSGSWVTGFRDVVPDVRTGTILWKVEYVGANSIPWTRPPSVSRSQAAGRWGTYHIVNIHGQPCLQEIPAPKVHQHELSGDIWYDRKNQRIIYFQQSLPAVPGLLESQRGDYGRPAPFYPCLGPPYSVQNWRAPVRRSTEWIYASQCPSRDISDQEPPGGRPKCITVDEWMKNMNQRTPVPSSRPARPSRVPIQGDVVMREANPPAAALTTSNLTCIELDSPMTNGTPVVGGSLGTSTSRHPAQELPEPSSSKVRMSLEEWKRKRTLNPTPIPPSVQAQASSVPINTQGDAITHEVNQPALTTTSTSPDTDHPMAESAL